MSEFRNCSFVLLGLTIVLTLAACAGKPAPDLQWSQTFPYAKYAQIFSSQQTTDGGYILCGDAYSRRGRQDILLIKTDADGNKLWDKTFGGEWLEQARSIQQTTDGGYVVCGSTYSHSHRPGDYSDIWLIKTDADGNKLWDRTFSVYNIRSWGHSIQQTTDGGYIVCGDAQIDLQSHSCICLIKTDASGNKLWDRTFGGNGFDGGNTAQQTTDGGYIVCGTKAPSGFSDIWLIKTDANGNELWDKTFGGERSDGVSSVQQTQDGGYIICGYQQPHDIGISAIWLIKTDANGNKLWDKTFGERMDSESRAARQTADGGYIILGTTHRFSLLGHFLGYRSGSIIWLIKTDAYGNKLWDATFPQGPHEGHVVQETIDGGYIVCLSGGDNIMLFKIVPEQ